MAITWRNKVSVLDKKRGNVSVTLEQVDDTDPENIKVLKSFSVSDALINTPERKKQVLDELKRQYHEKKQIDADKAEIIGTFTNDVNAAVQSWEMGI